MRRRKGKRSRSIRRKRNIRSRSTRRSRRNIGRGRSR